MNLTAKVVLAAADRELRYVDEVMTAIHAAIERGHTSTRVGYDLTTGDANKLVGLGYTVDTPDQTNGLDHVIRWR